MALQKTERLTLIEAREFEFPDKQTGTPVRKWQYVFLNSKNEFVTLYHNTDVYADRVVDASEFSEKDAEDYDLVGRVWEGKVTWRLA